MTTPTPLLQESKASAQVPTIYPQNITSDTSMLANQSSKYHPVNQSLKILSPLELARVNNLGLSEAAKTNPNIQLEDNNDPTVQMNKYMNQLEVSKPGIPNPLTSASQDNLRPNAALLGNLPIPEFGLPEVSLETLLQLYPGKLKIFFFIN